MSIFDHFPYSNAHQLNLDWILEQVKKAVEEVKTANNTANQATVTANETLDYVNRYFRELNLDEETAAVLDRMLEDGTLQTLINTYLAPEVARQDGEIAVLTARMNTFAALPDGSTAGDAELQDIRVGFDGAVYESAGEAARGQARQVQNFAEIIRKNVTSFVMDASFVDPSIVSENPAKMLVNGVVTDTANLGEGVSDFRPCCAGDTLFYTLSIQTGHPIIATYDKDLKFVNSVLGGGQSNYTTAEYTFAEGEAYFRICGMMSESYQAKYKLEYNGKVDRHVEAHAETLKTLSAATAFISKYTVSADAIKENTYVLLEPNGNLTVTPSHYGATDLRMCKPGDVLKYKFSCESNKPFIATYSAEGKLLNTVLGTGVSKYIEGEYTFTENDVFFRIAGSLSKLEGGYYYAEYVSAYNLESDTGALPDYYSDYMQERIAAINNKDCLIGSHGDSFIFITDTHIPRNKMRSPALIREIVNNTAVRFVINGGDTIDNNETWDEAVGLLRKWRSLMHGISEYRIMGNHDLNKSGNTIADAFLTTDDWYGTMVKPSENNVQTDGKYYFCVDNESQKIRYICLSYLISNAAEQNWLKERLTELEAGWTVLVIPHYLYDDATGTIHANGQKVIDCINEVYARMRATLIGILAGHNHADYSATEATNGYHLIATTCDTFTGTPTKTAGTTSEQAFDVIHIDTSTRKMYATRIGAGADREWDY